MAKEKLTPWKVSASFTRNVFSSHAYSAYCATALFYPFYLPIIVLIEWWKQWQLDGFLSFIWGCIHPPVAVLLPSGWQRLILMPALLATSGQLAVYGVVVELCPKKWTFGHTKTDTYRFKEQFHRFETVMPETRYVDDVSHWFCPKTRKMDK